MLKFWQILLAVLGLMTPGAVPLSTTLGMAGFQPVTRHVVPSQGGGYRRYGRTASGMPNDPRLLHRAQCMAYFSTYLVVDGRTKCQNCLSLLRALRERFGETAFVAPFGRPNITRVRLP
jgi:hypothetical protein